MGPCPEAPGAPGLSFMTLLYNEVGFVWVRVLSGGALARLIPIWAHTRLRKMGLVTIRTY